MTPEQHRLVTRFRCAEIAGQLRRAAILSDNAGHALREVAYLRWLSANPQIPDEVSLSIETAILRHRR
jgi:hypothetical protein